MGLSKQHSRRCRRRQVGQAMRTSSRRSGPGLKRTDTSSRVESSQQTLEDWRPVPGQNLYEVSSLGRVRSVSAGGVERTVLKTLKGRPGNEQYVRVQIRGVKYSLHRLVCLAFRGPAPEGKPNACHLNDDVTDNRAANLAWGSVLDNAMDRVRNGNQSYHDPGKLPWSKLTWETARAIRDRVAAGERQCDLATEYGVSRTTVCQLIKGKVWVEK